MKHTMLVLLFFFAACVPLSAQQATEATGPLDVRISSLENRTAQLPSELFVSFLFGAFCALWAMNTGRNSWLWFFLGLIFSVIAVLVLLYKNSRGRGQGPNPTRRKFDLQSFKEQ
jgi:hypothetical protein